MAFDTYAASGLTLSPSTKYFIVLTAGTAVANGAYDWSVMNTSSYNPDDSWVGSVTLGSNDGSSWRPLPTYPQFDFSQYAINATAIPEPSILGLSGICILVLCWQVKRPNNSPEPTPVALSVPHSRFTIFGPAWLSFCR